MTSVSIQGTSGTRGSLVALGYGQKKDAASPPHPYGRNRTACLQAVPGRMLGKLASVAASRAMQVC
jgi:hypothetical protein